MFEEEHKVKDKGSKITTAFNLPGILSVDGYSSIRCVCTLVIVSRSMPNIDR
jgi:hypothetical protein